ncbi:MAG: hypothetical protein PVH64_01145 [Bacillota bacterium]
MNSQDLEKLTTKLYNKFKGVPGVDQEFIRKCLTGIVALDDPTIESKLTMLINLL